MNLLQRWKQHLITHRKDWALATLLVLAAFLCHSRYLLTPELLFATEGDSFRQILPTSILFQNALAAGEPFWSWRFGLGGDIFTELSYAGTTSPFAYLQFVARWLFGGLGNSSIFTALTYKLGFSILKQALALTLMYALLRKEGFRPAYAFAGAVAYGCAPWFLYRAILFDFMTDAYVFLPLTMLAYGRYRRTGKWMLLSVAIGLMIGANLYFGYICCIYFAVVFLIMSAPLSKRDAIATGPVELAPGFLPYCKRVLRLLGIALVGAALSSVLLLPSANGVLSSDRTMANAVLTFLPRAETLRELFITLFGPNGMFALPLMCLLTLFIKWRDVGQDTVKRTLLALLFVALLCVPATSSIMNGFSYETPRWHFVVIFSVAYALPSWLKALEAQGGVSRPGFVWALCGALAGLYLALGDKTRSMAGLAWAMSFAMGLTGLLLVVFQGRIRSWGTAFSKNWGALVCILALLCGMLNSTGVRVHNLYRSDGEEAFFGSKESQMANLDLAKSLEEGGFFRVHDMGVDTHEEDVENRPYVYGTYGVSNYASLVNDELSTWHKKTFRFRTTPVCAGIYQSFDNRLFMDIAWNVRYKVPDGAGEQRLPSLWQQTKTASGQRVYESPYDVGFELWYDTAQPQQDWLNATVAQRDAQVLQTAAVAQEWAADYPAPVLDTVTSYLPLTFANAQVVGGEWDNGGLLHVENQATLTWQVEPESQEGEYLLSFSIAETSGQEAFSITAGSRTMDKFADTLASESLNYPLEGYAFRYDGSEDALSMTVSKGTYRLWDMELAFNRYTLVEEWVEALNRYNFDSLTVKGGRIDGSITVDEPGILALSMPYHKGWRCKVDGADQPLFAVNGIFTGLALSSGSHTVELRFIPPYLVLGACMTLNTMAALAIYAIWKRRRNKGSAGSIRHTEKP